MTNILIGGYYGAGNLGDEAILECMLSEMRQLNEDINFTVTSWNPADTIQKYKVQAVYWKDLSGIMDAAQRSDLIILGGGGLFQDYWGIKTDTYLRKSAFDITAYGSLPLLARLNNIPSMIYSMGLGPLSSEAAREHTRIAFENTQIATLRDHDSLLLLKKCGFEPKENKPQVLADPVFSLTTTSDDEKDVEAYFSNNNLDCNSEYLGVVLRYWDFSGPQGVWLQKLSDGVKKFLSEKDNCRVLLIPFQSNPENNYTDDEVILEKFSKLLSLPDRVHLVKGSFSSHFIQALIKKCNLLIGMRLHSLIMGINVNTPVIGLSYDPKVQSQMKEASLEEYCCTTLDLEPVDFYRMLIKGVVEKELIQQKMRAFHKKACENARKNADLAVKLSQTKERQTINNFQKLSLEQARLILELDEQVESKNNEIITLRNSVIGLNEAIKEQERKILEGQNAVALLNEQLKSEQLARTALHSQCEDNLQQIIKQTKQIDLLKNDLKNERKLHLDLDKKNNDLTTQLEVLKQQNERQSSEIVEINKQFDSTRNQLNSIYKGKSWKLISSYYRAIEKPPLNHLYHFLFHNNKNRASTLEIETGRNKLDAKAIIENVIDKLNSRKIRGIVFITSAFEYDRHCNQRVIHLTDFLSQKGFGILFIAWRWSKSDSMQNIGKEVEKNVFQIPVDYFLENVELFGKLNLSNKKFIIEFPNPGFLKSALQLKAQGFQFVYDIIDEWQEFHKVGQAIWYKKEYEEAIVLNADYVFAVSQPLADKFSDIRTDIPIVPNGFDPKLIGSNHQNIALKKPRTDEIHIGYYGHLTESWFDWNFLYDVMDLGLQKGMKVKYHLIGHGEPDQKNRVSEYKNNLLLYGKLKPKDLHNYVKDWDLAMIPFIPGKLAEAVDPLKIYEYLFFGLPVIVTGINHLESFQNVEVVKTPEEFLGAVQNLLTKKGVICQNKTDLFLNVLQGGNNKSPMGIKDFTWDSRFSNIIREFEIEKWIF